MHGTLPQCKKLDEAVSLCTATERIYGKELPSGARAYTVATPVRIIEELLRGFPHNNHWHECLNIGEAGGCGSLCDPYIDLDASVEEGFSAEQAHKAKAAVTKGMKMALSTCPGESKVVSYGSCGGDKNSWHVVGRHEGWVCESPDVAKLVTMVAICLSGEPECIWFAGGEMGKQKSLIDFSVYAHGSLRTVWSTKRGSKRIKVQEGEGQGGPQEGDEVHLVGAPAGWAGGVWTAKCVEAMCEPWGITLEEVVAQVSAMWAQRTGGVVTKVTNRLPNPGAMGCDRGDAGGATEEFHVASALCEALGPAWAPAGRTVWAHDVQRVSTTERMLIVQLMPMVCPYAGRVHKNNMTNIHLFVDQAPMLYSVVCMDEACRGHPRCVKQIVPFEVAMTYLPFPVSTVLDPVV
jgi:hypothetical protein